MKMKSITPGYMHVLMTHDPLCITKKKHSRNKMKIIQKEKATEFGITMPSRQLQEPPKC
jgi:hypothetical protein